MVKELFQIGDLLEAPTTRTTLTVTPSTFNLPFEDDTTESKFRLAPLTTIVQTIDSAFQNIVSNHRFHAIQDADK